MFEPQPVVLAGGRVRLEPFGPQHDADLLEAAQDDEVWSWQGVRPRTLDDVKRMRDMHPGMPWSVLVDGRACGSTSYLDIDVELGGLEIGSTWYAKAVWATDVNPQCKLLLLGYAFDDLGADRVTLKTDALNSRSRPPSASSAAGTTGRCATTGCARTARSATPRTSRCWPLNGRPPGPACSNA